MHPRQGACRALRRRSLWLDEASASQALAAPLRAPSGAAATSTTRASSRCSPAPCVRSRAAVQRGRVTSSCRDEVPGRRTAGARGAGHGSRRTTPSAKPTEPSSSSASTGSRRSWRRPLPATRRCSRCSPRTPSSPRRPRRSSARCCEAPGSSRRLSESRHPSEAPGGRDRPERQVVPQSVVSRQLANPFLAPDFAAAASERGTTATTRRLGAARPALQVVRATPAAAHPRAWPCRSRPRSAQPTGWS